MEYAGHIPTGVGLGFGPDDEDEIVDAPELDELRELEELDELSDETLDDDELEGRLDELEGRLEELDGRLDELDGRLEELEGRLAELDARLDDEERREEEDELDDDDAMNSLSKRARSLSAPRWPIPTVIHIAVVSVRRAVERRLPFAESQRTDSRRGRGKIAPSSMHTSALRRGGLEGSRGADRGRVATRTNEASGQGSSGSCRGCGRRRFYRRFRAIRVPPAAAPAPGFGNL